MTTAEPAVGDPVVMTTGSPSFDLGDVGKIIDVNPQAHAGVGYLIRFPRPFKTDVWCGPHEFRVRT